MPRYAVMPMFTLAKRMLCVNTPNTITRRVTDGYVKKLSKYNFLLYLKLRENPACCQPSPPKVRRKMVHIKGEANHISIPREPLPVAVHIFS